MKTIIGLVEDTKILLVKIVKRFLISFLVSLSIKVLKLDSQGRSQWGEGRGRAPPGDHLSQILLFSDFFLL